MAKPKQLSRFSWRPDIPDIRDRYFKAPRTPELPKSVSRIGMKNKIEDQGSLGSCTGNAATSALEIVLDDRIQLSRLMAYYTARTYIGEQNNDSGAYIRDAIKGLMKVGVCDENLWPYKPSKFRTQPSEVAYGDAAELLERMTHLEYARVNTLKDMKIALANRWPVVFGFSVPESFDYMPKSFLLTLPKSGEKLLGGHAVAAVGYNDNPKIPYIWVRNSWSEDWGIKGYFKMTQDWFTDPRRLTDDLWVIRPKVRN